MSLTYIDFLLSLPGYELSSDEEELPLQPDDPADGGSALDEMGNDSAWQCWRDGQICSAFCASR